LLGLEEGEREKPMDDREQKEYILKENSHKDQAGTQDQAN
jgi:hypothetical protein